MKGQNIWKNWQVQTKIIKKLGWSSLLPHFLLWGKYVSESLHRFFCQQKSYEDSSSSVQLFLQNSCYGDVQAVLLLCISYISSSNKNTSYNPQMCYWYVLDVILQPACCFSYLRNEDIFWNVKVIISKWVKKGNRQATQHLRVELLGF